MTHLIAALLLVTGLLSALLTGMAVSSARELRMSLLSVLAVGSTVAGYGILVAT